jgi:hypothetical protein
MKRLHGTYETEQEAADVVRALMADDYSAYKQGREVNIDDGGADDDYGYEGDNYGDY